MYNHDSAANAAFLSDQAVAARVLSHIRNGTTDLGGEVWREPVANYRNPERFRQEVENVLRRWPVPFCPSAALPVAGSYVAREAAGTPLLVVRGQDGRVRAFRNACRHRGTRLADGSGCSRSFVCPYHGWTYGLDGSLNHVPHAHGFPDLDTAQHGLAPVHCEERLGLVFVTQDPTAADPDSAFVGLPDLIGPEHRLVEANQIELDLNWKLYLEGFIEGYHIRATHSKSFYPYCFDNLNVVESCGANSRITFPFRQIESLAEVAPEERRVEGLLTYVYHLFPNALVSVMSRHTSLALFEPLAVDRIRLFTYVLIDRNLTGLDAALAKQNAELVGGAAAGEDLAVVRAIQRGIASGANEHFTFGRFESAIVHFHRTLASLIQESQM